MAFQKGKSGNPAGSKKVRVIAQQLTSALNEAYEGGEKSKLRAIIDRWIELAIAGDMQAITSITDRIDGRPAQTTDLNINDNRELRDLSTAELAERVSDALARIEAAANGIAGTAEGEEQPSDVRQLN